MRSRWLAVSAIVLFGIFSIALLWPGAGVLQALTVAAGSIHGAASGRYSLQPPDKKTLRKGILMTPVPLIALSPFVSALFAVIILYTVSWVTIGILSRAVFKMKG